MKGKRGRMARDCKTAPRCRFPGTEIVSNSGRSFSSCFPVQFIISPVCLFAHNKIGHRLRFRSGERTLISADGSVTVTCDRCECTSRLDAFVFRVSFSSRALQNTSLRGSRRLYVEFRRTAMGRWSERAAIPWPLGQEVNRRTPSQST